MDEEMEYAEMLEIPVSTVNVTKKRGRKPKKSQDLKEKVITKVNDGAEEETAQTTAVKTKRATKTKAQPTPAPTAAPAPATDEPAAKLPDAEEKPAGIDAEAIANPIVGESIPVAIPRRKKRPFFARLFGKSESEWVVDTPEEKETAASAPAENSSNPSEEELPIYNYTLWDQEEEEREQRRAKRNALIVGIEFAACFALCLGIFLTNVFMPNSAINTFFRSLGKTEQTDSRTYSDFTLSSILSDENAEFTLSPTGILSFQEAGCVYPAANGKVETLTQNADGTWTVKIAHSDVFSEIISGLSYVSCTVGSEAKSNVPLGYSDGNAEVQVSMYEEGELLNCFELTETGELAWAEE